MLIPFGTLTQCREEDSVLELKRQVALSSGVAVDRQRLIFKGKALHGVWRARLVFV